MFCNSCGTKLENTVKFCPSCGAAQPQTQAAPGALGQWQSQLESVPVVSTLQQRLTALPVPTVTLGAGGPVAAGPDLIWSAALALGALLGVWFMRWFMIPVFLAAGIMGLVYGVRPGVSAVTRSLLFVAAGGIGDMALAMGGSFGGTGVLGAMVLMVLMGRGVWGLLKEGRPGGDAFRLEGKRLRVLIIGLSVCLVSLFFQWEGVSTFNSLSWERVGTIYTDGAGRTVQDSTWLSPRVKTSYYGGDSGGMVFPWLAGAAILLLVFRNKPWPVWMRGALTVFVTFMLVYAFQGLGSYLGIGVILFCGGFGAITWSLLTRNA